ncbi:MAG: metallophosphoesterase [Eubacteriales bacterium]|nr:metallophosphoesterase [Eubacteriales bacterium]
MAAFLLAPFYILVNIYIVRWMFRWMGTCHYIFRTMTFQVLFAGIYIFLATTLLTGFLIKKPLWLHRILKNIGNYFLGTFLYILMIVAVVDFGRLLLKYVFHVSWIGSRAAFVVTGAVCMVLIISLSAYGIIHTMHVKVTPYEVKVNKQVKDMNSLKIVLIADVHFGYSVGARHAERFVEKINRENPDLVCFAGDIFDNEFDAFDQPERVKAALKSIKSRYGVYACWGNHDLNEPILAGFTFKSSSSDKEDPRMAEFLKDCGIHLLNDESELIDNKFYVVGRQDPARAKKTEQTRKTPAQLTERLDRSKPIIFIDHQPKELDKVSEAGADLDLCGHTHDGQIFPGNLAIHFFWENSCGYLKKGNMHNIVTSGVGVWGPNMRVGTDSEICSITVHFI